MDLSRYLVASRGSHTYEKVVGDARDELVAAGACALEGWPTRSQPR